MWKVLKTSYFFIIGKLIHKTPEYFLRHMFNLEDKGKDLIFITIKVYLKVFFFIPCTPKDKHNFSYGGSVHFLTYVTR